MDLTIQQLRMLQEVAVAGTIAAAAANLGYSPSAVSQQLGGLERAAGVAVLERVGRNVQLTDAGRELVVHARLVLAQIEEASASLERLSTEVSGTVLVGVMESVVMAFLPPFLRVLRERHPALQVRTREYETLDDLDWVRSGALDAGFIVDYPSSKARHEGLERLLVCNDWFKVVVPEGHRLTGPTVSLAELSGEPMIGDAGRSSCGQWAMQACRAAGFEPDFVHQLDDFPATLALVASGAGVAVVPSLGLSGMPAGVRVLELEEPMCRLLEFAYRTSSRDRPAIQALVSAVTAVAEELGLDRGVGSGKERGYGYQSTSSRGGAAR